MTCRRIVVNQARFCMRDRKDCKRNRVGTPGGSTAEGPEALPPHQHHSDMCKSAVFKDNTGIELFDVPSPSSCLLPASLRLTGQSMAGRGCIPSLQQARGAVRAM